MSVNVDAGSVTRMSMTELDGPNDPLRKIYLDSPDPDLKVWVQRDPLRAVTNISAEYRGMQAHREVSDLVLNSVTDHSIVLQETVKLLMDDLQHPLNREAALRALPLSKWRELIDKTITDHIMAGFSPERVILTPEVFRLISVCVDDLPGTLLQKRKREGMAQRLPVILPKGMQYGLERPKEAEALVSIKVK